jgi:hypothetical protein
VGVRCRFYEKAARVTRAASHETSGLQLEVECNEKELLADPALLNW